MMDGKTCEHGTMKFMLPVLVLLLTSLPMMVTGICISSNDSSSADCNSILISRSLKSVNFDSQVNIQETQACKIQSFNPTAKYGSSSLKVRAHDYYRMQIDLPPEEEHPPTVYDIQLSLLWQTCNGLAIEMNQSITVYIVGTPVIRLSRTEPSSGYQKLNCELSLDLTPHVATRFERNEEILGYCEQDLQTFAGGYKMYYSSSDQKTCILEVDDKLYGNYTCTAIYEFYGGIKSEVTAIQDHTHNTSKTNEIVGLSVGVGVLVFLFIIASITAIVVCIKHGIGGGPCHR